jgi:hypothetical protein
MPGDAAAEKLGEAESYNTGGPAIAQQENIGATYKIVTSVPAGRGSHVQQRSDYLMPNVPMAWNGEPVVPAIQITPLGAEMPSPGMPPPIVAGHKGAFPLAEDNGQFKSGIIDGWPDGVPIPVNN